MFNLLIKISDFITKGLFFSDAGTAGATKLLETTKRLMKVSETTSGEGLIVGCNRGRADLESRNQVLGLRTGLQLIALVLFAAESFSLSLCLSLSFLLGTQLNRMKR